MKKTIIALLLFWSTCTGIFAQILSSPSSPKLVNDYTNTLSSAQETTLERKLVSYNDSTSTQILVMLVNSFEGYEPSDFAFALGNAWGIGQDKKNNGIIILVKPKNVSSKGQAFIATGYGMEAIVPDALAKRIVENEMIPAFKNNDYYTGINKAVDAIISLASGTYKSDQTEGEPSPFIFLIPFLALLLIIIIIYASKSSDDITGGNNNSSGDKSNRSGAASFLMGLWLGSLGSRSGSGSWGGFSGGSHGGGFGGFGGGSFGGGGAGGSW